jgi:hypothetical protein
MRTFELVNPDGSVELQPDVKAAINFLKGTV